jgi:hypothetical protein
MSAQRTIDSPSLPPSVQRFIIAFMQAVKAGRLYSSGHTLFKQSVKRLHDQLEEAGEERDFLFMGFAKDSLLISDEFLQVNDVHSREFLGLFHPLGISHLIVQKESTIQELESFVEILSGAKPCQGQEVLMALQHENIKRINLGLLDYSVLSGLESAVSHGGRRNALVKAQASTTNL